jgi:16S rRNA (uracil1498-N3)-methyltransferase
MRAFCRGLIALPRQDFRKPRLYVPDDLRAGSGLSLGRDAANYLKNVLRLEPGAEVLLFNGRHGEWRARLNPASKREVRLEVLERTRPQTISGDLEYAFAPLKHARLDYMVQKAVEMGAGRLTPIITRHTQVARVNLERMRANAIEAAEQCGILSLPEIDEPESFAVWLARGEQRTIVFCDEEADGRDPLATLAGAPAGKLTLLIGPEGGFSGDERRALLARPSVLRLSLGPRILRADTAAIAALALLQAARGDWR